MQIAVFRFTLRRREHSRQYYKKSGNIKRPVFEIREASVKNQTEAHRAEDAHKHVVHAYAYVHDEPDICAIIGAQ